MIETSQNVDALFAAIHKAQGDMRGVAKDSKNPHFRSSYASLENVIDAAKAPLQAAGLAFTQAPGALVDGAIEVTTMLMHTSGQWLRSTLHVPLQKRDPQGVGSAITYGCRYALMATLGLPPVDDDGESAMDRNSQPAPMTGRAAPVSSGTNPAHSETGAPLTRLLSSDAEILDRTLRKVAKKASTQDDLRSWWTLQVPKAKEMLPADAFEALKQYIAETAAKLPERAAA